MRYYENDAGGYILSFGASDYGGEEISEERFNAIQTAMSNAPEETETTGYRLKTDLTWEAYSIEPVDPDIDDAELLDILMGVTE